MAIEQPAPATDTQLLRRADEEILMSPRGRWKSWLASTVLLLGLVVCGAYLCRLIATQQLELRIAPYALLAILAMSTAALASAALFWRDLVLETTRERLTFMEIAVGQTALMLGKYIPGKVVGIAGRIASVASKVSVPRAMALAMAEQMFLLAGLLITGLLAHSLVKGSVASLAGAAAIAIVATCPSGIATKLVQCTNLSSHKLVGPRFRTALDAMSKLGPAISIRGLAYSGFAALCVAATAWFVPDLLSLDLGSATRAGLVMSYALAIVGGMLAFVIPGGIGAREAVFVLLASSWLATTEAASIAAVLRLVNVSFDLLAGLICVILIRRSSWRIK